jgi:hypothetical protein
MRRIVSLTLLLAGILVVLTSVVLYIAPHGRVAFWSGWRFWGLTKPQWVAMHINLGLLVIIAGVIHTMYNLKPICAYIRRVGQASRNSSFNIALALVLVVVLGTFFNIPPMSTVIRIGERLTDQAGEVYGEPPYGHAEQSSFRFFTERMKIDQGKALALLRQAGITVTSERQTIGEIAAAHRVTPARIYEIMKPAEIKPAAGEPFPDFSPPGFGRRTIDEICSSYRLDLALVLSRLHDAGLEATADMSVREIAAAAGQTPINVFEVIQRVAKQREAGKE